MAKPPGYNAALYTLLARADETYRQIPPDLQLQIDKVSRALPELGPRLMNRKGQGMELFDLQPFNPETDEPREISQRHFAKTRKLIAVKREAEIRQHVFLWRDGSAAMEYSSLPSGLSKKGAAEIQLLALAKHLARNEEAIGILGGRGVHRESRAVQALGSQLLLNVNIVTGEGFPVMGRNIPRNSTAILFSDFMVPQGHIAANLSRMAAQGLRGHLVMVLDPQEVDFTFKGHMEFRGLRGEGTQVFKQAQAARPLYLQKLQEHVEAIRTLCSAHAFGFTLQRTDAPLQNSLLAIYGLPVAAQGLQPGLRQG